jgi:hypothetical protein
VIELVYDAAAWPFIKERFPHAVWKDASDQVHEGRFEVTLPDSDKDAFIKHSIREGYCDVCLGFKLSTMTEGPGLENIKRILAEMKAEDVAAKSSQNDGDRGLG